MEQSLESSENCSEEVRWEASMYVRLSKGSLQSEHILVKVYCSSGKINILVNSLSAFLNMGRCKKMGSLKFLLKKLHYMRVGSASFPRAQGALGGVGWGRVVRKGKSLRP